MYLLQKSNELFFGCICMDEKNLAFLFICLILLSTIFVLIQQGGIVFHVHHGYGGIREWQKFLSSIGPWDGGDSVHPYIAKP